MGTISFLIILTMKIINFFMIICILYFVSSCSDKTDFEEFAIENTSIENQDSPLIAEYKAIMNGKDPKDSFLKNIKFYDSEGNIINRDVAFANTSATIRDDEPFFTFSYEEELLVTNFCCDVELEVEDVKATDTWFITTTIYDHEAIQNADVLYFRRLTFEYVNLPLPTVSYLWTSIFGNPCVNNTITVYVAGFDPGAFQIDELKVTSDIGFLKHNAPLGGGANTGLENFFEVCDESSKNVFYN